MVYSTTDKIFAAIWVAALPITIALSIFLCILIYSTTRKSIDIVIASLVVSRILHCGGVSTMAAVFKLEHWRWTAGECDALLWLWITSWASDFLITLTSLAFYSGRIARKSPRSTIYGILFVSICWTIAIAAGGMPLYVSHLFVNYKSSVCNIGLTDTNNPIPTAVIPILVIGLLLQLALVVAICTETQSKILIYWTSRKAEIRRDAYALQRSQKYNGHAAPSNGTLDKPAGVYWIGNEDSMNQVHTTSTEENSENTEWIRSERSMIDTRNINVAASISTILCELTPQLVFFALDLGIDFMYPYSHHVLISTGLLHALMLPVLLITLSPRYKATCNERWSACTRKEKSTAVPRQSTVQNKTEQINIEDGEAKRYSTRSNNPPPSPRAPYMITDESEITVLPENSQNGPAIMITGVTDGETMDTTVHEPDTESVKNGHVKNDGVITEVQVVIENVEAQSSQPPDDRKLYVTGLSAKENGLLALHSFRSITRSSSACVDRRQVKSCEVNTAVIRRSPSSLSQMINPPVPDSVDGHGSRITRSDTNNELKSHMSQENVLQVNGVLPVSSGTSTYCDSDSELWSNLYEETDGYLSEISDDSPERRESSVKATVPPQNGVIRRHRRQQSIDSLNTIPVSNKRSKKKKPHGRKRRASVDTLGANSDKQNKGKDHDLKQGLSSVMKLTFSTSLVMPEPTPTGTETDAVVANEPEKRPEITDNAPSGGNASDNVQDTIDCSDKTNDDEQVSVYIDGGKTHSGTLPKQEPFEKDYTQLDDITTESTGNIELKSTNPFLSHTNVEDRSNLISMRSLSSSNPFLVHLSEGGTFSPTNPFLGDLSQESLYSDEYSAPFTLQSTNPFFEILAMSESKQHKVSENGEVETINDKNKDVILAANLSGGEAAADDNENENDKGVNGSLQRKRERFRRASTTSIEEFLMTRSEDSAEIV